MKLSAIARERAIPFEKVLTEFLLEGLLARLVNSKQLASAFIFKGGYVGRRAYYSPRYTVDLDALLRTGKVSTLQVGIIEAVESDIDDDAWFRFEETQDLQTQGEYPGVRFVFRSGIGEMPNNLQRSQIVNFDVGVGDFVKPVELTLKSILGEQELSWSVYTREVMVAEKLHSFLSRPLGNSRAKDVFDLMFYLPDCQREALHEAVKETFAARSDPQPIDVPSQFQSLRTETLRKGWASAVANVSEAESFDAAFEKVIELLKSLF